MHYVISKGRVTVRYVRPVTHIKKKEKNFPKCYLKTAGSLLVHFWRSPAGYPDSYRDRIFFSFSFFYLVVIFSS